MGGVVRRYIDFLIILLIPIYSICIIVGVVFSVWTLFM